jgi:hypothetical protein
MRFSRMKHSCSICRGVGWVCERHPDRPYDYETGCACGYAAPCECNDSDPPDAGEIVFVAEEPRGRSAAVLKS